MIPILYEAGETAFITNGLGRLRDCISCVVTEERNGIYECDFEYPIDGVNYDRIKCGRIILVEHDETNDTQPFDIVGYSKPINGVVTFHAVHISYRQCALTVAGNTDWNNVNTLADALNWLTTADPENPFAYWTDKSSSTGYLLASNGIPYSVRSVLGGMEGSILDVYGGEYEWDRWTVRLWDARGSIKNFSIRYGVNLTNYEEEMDYSDTYTSVVPYWVGQDNDGNDVIVKGDMVTSSYPSFNGTGRCIPLDLSERYETKPTKATVEAAGLAYMNANQTYLPAQSIKVDFVKLSDSDEYAQFANLQKCKLCDSINVIFPRYDMQGTFKIVRAVYNVLREKYDELELGTLSTSLAEALGISQESSTRLGGGGGAVAGVIQMFAGETAPDGWLLCDGTAVSRTQYASLFAVIQTKYGTGDGSTTFNLPDLRGKFALGVSGSHALASSGGAETVKLTGAESGVQAHSHSHTLAVSPSAHKLRLASVALGSGGTSRNIPNSGSGTSNATFTDSHSLTGSISNATAKDATSAHENMPPFISVNYIISTGG